MKAITCPGFIMQLWIRMLTFQKVSKVCWLFYLDKENVSSNQTKLFSKPLNKPIAERVFKIMIVCFRYQVAGFNRTSLPEMPYSSQVTHPTPLHSHYTLLPGSLTRKTWLALSLRVESSGLSTGVWRVNFESNWLTSSSDCFAKTKWLRVYITDINQMA